MEQLKRAFLEQGAGPEQDEIEEVDKLLQWTTKLNEKELCSAGTDNL